MTEATDEQETRRGNAESESGLTREEVDAERKERLDPESRPDKAEVDNSDRDFDMEKGMYTDSEGYDQAEKQFYPEGEQGA
ncbi:hypothetical protein [Nocardioides sp.]|jgi:hypothetical protein|uniref:hypothetical protein n=1 Tax=Nocardioides sp. TaxID=35761 RepID=UPI0031FE5438|nr:hypothetical protein [Nocardioides sp.]